MIFDILQTDVNENLLIFVYQKVTEIFLHSHIRKDVVTSAIPHYQIEQKNKFWNVLFLFCDL